MQYNKLLWYDCCFVIYVISYSRALLSNTKLLIHKVKKDTQLCRKIINNAML